MRRAVIITAVAMGTVSGAGCSSDANGRPDAGGVYADGAADTDAHTCSTCGGATPLCVAGMCVECGVSSDCSTDPSKPICDIATHTCGPCTADSQCADKLGPTPGVCMAHQDGRCAIDAETVYVQLSDACSEDGAGTAAVPFCSMTPAAAAIVNSDVRTLVVVRGLVNSSTVPFARSPTRSEASIVGQQSAVIAGRVESGLDVRSGVFYVRGIKVTGGIPACINAVPTTGSAVTLRLEQVMVDSCQGGGILLDGAAFDIRNSTIINNGPGTLGAVRWGGILVNNPAGAGPASLSDVTVRDNKQVGVTCSSAISGSGVLASMNTGDDINPTCGFSSCGTESSACGAQ